MISLYPVIFTNVNKFNLTAIVFVRVCYLNTVLLKESDFAKIMAYILGLSIR